MTIKNPAAEEWKPGFWDLGTGVDLVSQSQTPAGWLRRLIEGIKHFGSRGKTARYGIFRHQIRTFEAGMIT
jgi:hypothetical protein